MAMLIGMMFMVMNNFVLGIVGDAYGAVKEENQAYPSLFKQLWDLNMLEVRMYEPCMSPSLSRMRMRQVVEWTTANGGPGLEVGRAR